MKKVLVTARSFGQSSKEPIKLLYDNGFEIIFNPHGRPLTEEELLLLIKDVDGMIAGLDDINGKVLRSALRLKVIVRYGVGVNNVDINTAKSLGIVVKNTPGCNQDAVAELAVSMMLALSRQLLQASNSTKKGEWKRFIGGGVFGKTIGVIGLGKIGREVVKRLKGFSPRILVYDPITSIVEIEGVSINNVSLDEAIRMSDILTLHIPLTPDTRNLIDKKRLSQMKKGAIIINTSRGGIINEADLFEYLDNGHLGGAGIDVYEAEPPTGNKLLELENVIATPHMGAYTYEALDKMGMMCAQTILEFLL